MSAPSDWLLSATNLAPDLNPDGSALSGSGTRYYKFTFTTISNTSIKAYVKGDAFIEESIIRIFKSSDAFNTNIINTSNIIDIQSGYSINANNEIIVATAVDKYAFSIQNLEPFTSYTLISKTTFNDPGPDLQLYLYSETQNLPLTYTETSTSTSLFVVPVRSDWANFVNNLIPNTNPNGSALSFPSIGSGIRLFKFSFVTTNTNSINVYITTNNTSGGDELIYRLYEEGTYNNLINTTNITNVQSGVTLNTSGLDFNIRIDSNFNNLAFTISNLKQNTTYYLISRTSWNDLGTDVGAYFYSRENFNQIPLTYTQTSTNTSLYQPTVPTDNSINYVSLTSYSINVSNNDGEVQGLNALRNPQLVSYPLILYDNIPFRYGAYVISWSQTTNTISIIDGSTTTMRYTFDSSLQTYAIPVYVLTFDFFNRNILNKILFTGSPPSIQLTDLTTVTGITYDNDINQIDSLTYPLTLYNNINFLFNSNTYKLIYIRSLNEIYFYIDSTLTLKFNYDAIVKMYKIYYDVNNRSNLLDNTVYFLTSQSDTTLIAPPNWQSNIDNLVPDTDPSGNELTNPGLNIDGTRYFKFSFTTTDTTSIHTFLISNSNSIVDLSGGGRVINEFIYRLYEENTFINLINSNTIVNLQNGISFGFTIQNTLYLESNYNNYGFTISNLKPNTTYYLIVRTSNNDTGIDIGAYFKSVQTLNKIPLTYVDTNTSISLYQPTLPTDPSIPFVTMSNIINSGNFSYTEINTLLTSSLANFPLILYHNNPYQYSDYLLVWSNITNQITIRNLSNSILHTFTYNHSLGRYSLTTDSTIYFSSTLETIQLKNLVTNSIILYDTDINQINALSYPLTLYNNVEYQFNSNTYSLRYIESINEIYFYINSTLTLKFNYDTTNKIYNIYYDVNNRENLLDNTVFFDTSESNFNYVWPFDSESIIPDRNPNNTVLTNPGLESGIRYFKFSFTTTNTTSITVRVISNNSSSSEELLVRLYEEGEFSNLLNSTNITNLQTGITLNSNSTISLDNNFNGIAFDITNLTQNTTYYLISKTSFNNSGSDISIYFQSNQTTSKIPLTYVQTEVNTTLYQPTTPTVASIPFVSLSSYNNTSDISGVEITSLSDSINVPFISYPLILYHNVAFQYGDYFLKWSNITNVITILDSTNTSIGSFTYSGTLSRYTLTTDSNVWFSATFTSIQLTDLFTVTGVSYDADINAINSISYPLTLLNNIEYQFNSNTYSLRYIQSINEIYFFVNSILTLKFNYNNNAKIYVIYYDLNNRSSLLNGSVFFSISNSDFTSLTPSNWQSNVINITPDANPNGTALNNPNLDTEGNRYYKFSFTTTNTTSIKVFVISNRFSGTITPNINVEEIIFRIYEENTYINMINSNNIIDLQSGTALVTATNFPNTIAISSNFNNYAFQIRNLKPNTTYNLISLTTWNDPGIDVGIYLNSIQTFQKIPLTYEQTINNTSLYQPITPTNPFIPFVNLSAFTNGSGNTSNQFVMLNSSINPSHISYPLVLYHDTLFQYNIFLLLWSNITNEITIRDLNNTLLNTLTYNHSLGRYSLTTDANIYFSASLSTIQLTDLFTLPAISYDTDINQINSLSYPLTLYDNVEYQFNSNSYSLRYIQSINEIYFFINSTLTLKFNYDSTNKIWNIYYDVNNRSNLLDNTVFFSTSETNINLIWLATTDTIIPDTNPNGTELNNPGLENGIRLFKFSFTTTNTTSITVRVKSNSTSSDEELLVRLYQENTLNNLINSINIINLQSGITLNSNATISVSNNFNGIAFDITNLIQNTNYYLITRTTSNNSGADLEVYFQSIQNNSKIPLTYLQTEVNTSIYQLTTPTDPSIPFVSLSSYTNTSDLSGVEITSLSDSINDPLIFYPLILYNNVAFQYGDYFLKWSNITNEITILDSTLTTIATFTYNGSLNRYTLSTNSNIWFSATLETTQLIDLSTVTGVSYDSDVNSINSLTYPITLLNNIEYLFNSNSYSLRYIHNVNEIYFYVNSVLTLKFNYNNTYKIYVIYYDLNNRSNLLNSTVFFVTPISDFSSLIPSNWQSNVDNVIPDINPNGTALTNPGLEGGIRYFKFSFTTINTTSINVYTVSNSFSADASDTERLLRIYEENSYSNLINSTNIVNVQSRITLDLANLNITIGNSFNNFAFQITNLIPNKTYYLIVRTIWNDAGADIAVYFQSLQTNLKIPLTYTETTTTSVLYQPTIPIDPIVPYVSLNSFVLNAGTQNDLTHLNDTTIINYPLILQNNIPFQYRNYFLKWLNITNTIAIIENNIEIVTFSYNHSLGRYAVSNDVKERGIVGQVWFTSTLLTVNLFGLYTIPGLTYDTHINSIKDLLYPLTLYDNVDYSFNDNTYTLRYISRINEIYFFINSTLTLKFNFNNTSKTWNIYYDVNNTESLLDNTVFFKTSDTNYNFIAPSNWQTNSITSIVPDTNPDSSSLTSPNPFGIRYFVFSFNSGSSRNFNFFITSFESTENFNSIVSIYKNGSIDNIINSTFIKNIQTNVTLNSEDQSITIGNSFDGFAFSLENVDTSSTYYIIIKSINNQIGPDLGLLIVSKFDGNSIPLVYDQNINLPIFYSNSFFDITNIIPTTNPDLTPLENPSLDSPADRFFRFSFTTPNTNSLSFFFTSMLNENSIVYIFKEKVSFNLINSQTITNIDTSVSVDFTSPRIIINNNIYGNKGFTLTNIEPNAKYYFISKTNFNSTNSSVGLVVLDEETNTSVPITYEATANLLQGAFLSPEKPNAPPIFIRPDADDKKITFYWSYPDKDGYSPVTTYLLSSISHNCNILIDPTIYTEGEYTIENLTNGVEYSFQIAASNSVGLSPFVEYRTVAPGMPALPMSFSTVNINITSGEVVLNSILNPTSDTPAIKYIIYKSVPQGESLITSSNIQTNIFTTNESISIINLNTNSNWNVYGNCVTDAGYSDQVSSFISFFIPNTSLDPESVFFRTQNLASNSFVFYRSTVTVNTTTLPSTTDWTFVNWKANSLGVGVILRSVANSRIYMCQFLNRLGETIASTNSFYGPAIPSNFFSPNDGVLMYGLYPSTNSLMNYIVYNFSTNTLVLSTIEGISTININSAGTLYSNFAFIGRSTTTIANISNIYTFECEGSNSNTYHPKYVDTFGSGLLTSNTVDRKCYFITRPSTLASGTYTKLYCFNNSTPYTVFNIASANFTLATVFNPFSKNIINICESAKNFVYDFNLPENNNPIYSNSFTGTFAVLPQITRFSPLQQGNTTLFSSWVNTFVSSSVSSLIVFSPSSSNIFSTLVFNGNYLNAHSPNFNVIRYFTSENIINFATIDITGKFSTFTTNILSTNNSVSVQLSNNNTIIYLLSNLLQPNSTLIYSFQYHNSSIFFYSTMVSTNNSFTSLRTSNATHNYFSFTSGATFYIPPGLPPSSLGSEIQTQTFRSLRPPNETSFGINSTNGKIYVFSNADLLSTISPSNFFVGSQLFSVTNNDACFVTYRNPQQVLVQRVSTNGYFTSAVDTEMSLNFSNKSFTNFSNGLSVTGKGACFNYDAMINGSSNSMTIYYDWTTDRFDNFSNFYYGVSNITTYSNANLFY